MLDAAGRRVCRSPSSRAVPLILAAPLLRQALAALAERCRAEAPGCIGIVEALHDAERALAVARGDDGDEREGERDGRDG